VPYQKIGMFMRKLSALLLFTIFVGSVASAQKITGLVKDQQGKGLDKTTVSLLRASDSSTVKLSTTDNTGKFSFETTAGKYLVNVSHVGYVPLYSKVFDLSADIILEDMSMIKAEGNLQGVTVSSQKPIVEVKADRTILNVEGTINAVGNDALELLRKSPGVIIDKDDNISLSGKNGVRVYIDGKPSPLSGADLAAYLKSLQSSQIESIELITNPSAKYEAEGNAGIINIRLKKNKAFGTNGSANAGYNIGTYGKYNAGINLNHRNKNINIFGTYNFNHNYNKNVFRLYRDVADTIFDGNNRMYNKTTSHGFKAGLDYTLSSRSVLGIMVNGTISDNDMQTDGSQRIIYKPTGVTDRILRGDNTNDASRENVNFNLNYRYADTAGHELNIDADYGTYSTKSDQLQPNVYFTPGNPNPTNSQIFSFISPSDIDILSLKADYEQNFKGGKLGFGFKTSLTKTDNNFGSYDVVGQNKYLDIAKSNQFNYTENINAVYVNYNKQFKKGIMLQAGLRVENTNSKGDSYGLKPDGTVDYSAKQTFDRHYTDPFPSAAVTFNKNPMKQWSITYSRRIDRPAYQDLNPFLFKLNIYTYQKGNTELTPQYTNTIGITNVYKFKLTTTLNYSHVNDVFTQLVDTAEVSKAFITKKNLAKQDIVSLNVSYPFMYKNYMWFTNLNTFYSRYKADFGGGSRKVNVDVFSYNVYMQHSLKFGKKKQWTGEVSGFYTAPSIWQGTFKSKALWSIDGGLQKTIFKGKGNIKASVSDIFKTLKWKGTSNFADQITIASGYWESRQFKINMTWRFGSSTVKAARNRKISSEDENKRTEGGGGIGAGN
jgi:iron complex outermembrane recepter protein